MIVCMTTLNTVAIGIRKQNLAGGVDANESTVIPYCQMRMMALSLKAKRRKKR